MKRTVRAWGLWLNYDKRDPEYAGPGSGAWYGLYFTKREAVDEGRGNAPCVVLRGEFRFDAPSRKSSKPRRKGRR